VLEQFEQAWRSQDHRKKDNLQEELSALISQLDRERKRSRIILGICGTYTIITTIVIATVLAQRQTSLGEVGPLLAAQCIAIVVLASLVRTRLAKDRETSAKTAEVREAATKALRSTHSGIRTVKLVAISMAAILLLSMAALPSLYSSGKMDDRALSSLISLFALVAIFNASILWLKWTRKLRPRRDRLSEIVRDLDA
jgi:hypothetical protein